MNNPSNHLRKSKSLDISLKIKELEKKLHSSSTFLTTCSQPISNVKSSSFYIYDSFINSDASSFHTELDAINESPVNVDYSEKAIILDVSDISHSTPRELPLTSVGLLTSTLKKPFKRQLSSISSTEENIIKIIKK